MNTWLLILDRVRRVSVDFPQTMRAGLRLAALAAVIDIALPMVSNASSGNGAIPFIGHLVPLVGMIVTVAAIDERANFGFGEADEFPCESSIHPQTLRSKVIVIG